ncbi:hypothetical protein MAR_028570 [Mya arenaria]|uniref:Uncharacterized protein n=1 Tax=Mya arenaria TaxID=6604 RepID=A0ABY7DGR4_MYAAR|nr:hypothetical protein MAR_028570 [Mya arenaria]
MSIEKDGIPQDLLDPSEEAEIHYYDAEGSLDSSTAKKRKKKKTKRHRKDAILELVNEVENIRTFTVGPGKSIVGELPDINIKNNDTRKKTDTKLEEASGLESIGIEAPGIPTVSTGLPDLTQENNDISKRIAESHPIVKNEREEQTKTKYIETDGGQSLDVERGDGKDRNQDKGLSVVQKGATIEGVQDSIANTILSVEDSTWIVVIQELMIYVLLCVVWLLDNVPHDLLSQQLIAFLASASDIMELYALFDESAVQKDFTVTCVVLGVWTDATLCTPSAVDDSVVSAPSTTTPLPTKQSSSSLAAPNKPTASRNNARNFKSTWLQTYPFVRFDTTLQLLFCKAYERAGRANV